MTKSYPPYHIRFRSGVFQVEAVRLYFHIYRDEILVTWIFRTFKEHVRNGYAIFIIGVHVYIINIEGME